MENKDQNISVEEIAGKWAKLVLAQIQAKQAQPDKQLRDENKEKHE